ncbi:hypothetical protein BIV25_35730 [Streptomyces sp. MUSC 14]|uniref:hypothetical protein n=1 Tax=Streptomyces sp. MUSC 14 TaxID=1354889 RepID=UPI0008F5B768|nr:hypothetical protein [Streptomyces sp. MUSC 14]OIJ88847.1 hypothetical protein BIV25_35730 [Streptomyces sp. MUSC 14]
MNAVGTPTTAHVADTTHTPTGRHDATLTSAHPDNPTTHTTHTPLDHTPQPDPARIEDTRLSNTDTDTDSAGKENLP